MSAVGQVGDLWPVFGYEVDPEMLLEQQLKYKYLGLHVFASLKGIEKDKGQDLLSSH